MYQEPLTPAPLSASLMFSLLIAFNSYRTLRIENRWETSITQYHFSKCLFTLSCSLPPSSPSFSLLSFLYFAPTPSLSFTQTLKWEVKNVHNTKGRTFAPFNRNQITIFKQFNLGNPLLFSLHAFDLHCVLSYLNVIDAYKSYFGLSETSTAATKHERLEPDSCAH